MKNIFYGSCMMISILTSFMILGTVHMSTIQLQELNRISNVSILNLGNYMLLSNRNDSYDFEEVKNILQYDMKCKNTKGILIADIIVCDEQKQIIKIEYTTRWNQLNKTTKEYKTTRTIMIDQSQ